METDIYNAIAAYISPTMTTVMLGITRLGSFYVVAGLSILLFVIPLTRNNLGNPTCISVSIASVAGFALKHLVARERPGILPLAIESGYAFPSGHALCSAAFFFVLAFMIFDCLRGKSIILRVIVVFVAVMIVFLVGISRIYLGVHRAGDVLAGWALGLCISIIIVKFKQRIACMERE